MELKVKKIKIDSTLSDKGFVTDVHTLTMIGSSTDGEMEATLVLKSEDPDRIKDMVKMVHGTKMNLELKDVNHALDEFDTLERPPITLEADAEAYEARMDAAQD